MQEGFFPASVFDKLVVNMTSCSEVEDDASKEDGRQENSSMEIDKTLATLEAILMHRHWGQIFCLFDETCQHMVTALKHSELFANEVQQAILRENCVLLVSKITKAHFLSVATSSKGLLQEESNLPMVHTSDGFDLDAYKLMEELRYNFNKQPSPGHVIDIKPYGPNDVKKMVQK